MIVKLHIDTGNGLVPIASINTERIPVNSDPVSVQDIGGSTTMIRVEGRKDGEDFVQYGTLLAEVIDV